MSVGVTRTLPAVVASLVAEQRREQGLPPQIEDPSALRALAALVAGRAPGSVDRIAA
jgi:hypothetical protein